MKPVYQSVVILLFIILFNITATFAQTTGIALQENTIAAIYSKLVSSLHSDYDSVSLYSARFQKQFINLIRSNPKTIDYPFNKLTDSSFCRISTSADGNFRIYSWDTRTGGTMHFFKEIYQWRDKGKVFTRIPVYDDGDAGSYCSKIFTVNIHGKPYYLAVGNGVFSSQDAMQSISVYTITNSKLIDTVKLFKTKTKRLNSIHVPFNFFSVANRPERPLELISYDEQQQIIYVPVVDNDGQVTQKNILYQLKGAYFEFIGIETGKR